MAVSRAEKRARNKRRTVSTDQWVVLVCDFWDEAVSELVGPFDSAVEARAWVDEAYPRGVDGERLCRTERLRRPL
jgi:hypothetical protein